MRQYCLTSYIKENKETQTHQQENGSGWYPSWKRTFAILNIWNKDHTIQIPEDLGNVWCGKLKEGGNSFEQKMFLEK